MYRVPKNLVKNVVSLTNKRGQWVHVLGSAHISLKSCEHATELVHAVKPSAVFLELCEQRSSLLSDDEGDSHEPLTYDEMKDMWKAYSRGEINAFTMIYSYFMRSFDVKPGGEFKAAYNAALQLEASVILGDRPVAITTKRFWSGLTFYQKTSLVYHIAFPGYYESPEGKADQTMEDTVNELIGDKDLLDQEFRRVGKICPWLVECLISERDKFMTLEMEKVCYYSTTFTISAHAMNIVIKCISYSYWYRRLKKCRLTQPWWR